MSENNQDPVEKYIAKRGGDPNSWFKDMDGPLPSHTLIRIASWLAILGFAAYFIIPRSPLPIQLTYEIDLERAPKGSLVITLMAEGDLPRHMNLDFPPGVFGDATNGVTPHSATAHELNPDGSQGKPLAVERTSDGWQVSTGRASRTGFVYQIDLNQAHHNNTDVRNHISTPVAGGIRAAGFEVFLQPTGVEVDHITVTLHNPGDLEVLVPWPALVKKSHRAPPETAPASTGSASISQGQGYLPAPGVATSGGTDPGKAPATPAVPDNLLFHPHDLADLNNALLVCGDLQIATTQVRECVIQLATDHSWNFPLGSALDMIRRIARTEMGFFGSAPTNQITVILSPNRVGGEGRFDLYGIHTGSSVLVMMDPATTWGDLEDQSASVIAHEMFHGWLGEAIPQRDPDMLWFTEGATTWYAARMLTAAGVWSPDHARAVLQTRLDRDYTKNRLKNRITVAEASAEVMAGPEQVRFAYAASVSACMNLDKWLTERTGQQRPLDLVLRHLYEVRDGSPLTRLGLEAAVLEATGVECTEWLEKHVYSKTILPMVERLI